MKEVRAILRIVSLSAALWCAPAALLAQTPSNAFETKLGLTPTPDGVRAAITGTGTVMAILEGQTLKVEGQFSGLNGAATDAHLMQGPGIGIPGAAMMDIALGSDKRSIGGSVKLSREQITALKAGHIYVQVNSDKSPAPTGHLWGWLLPAHEKAAEDEPQQGRWYLPQGLGLQSRARGNNS